MKPATKKAVPEKHEIVKSNGDDFAPPEYLISIDTKPNEGFEEVQPGDLKVPRLALTQALSPQLNEDSEKYISGLKRGEWFNTLTGRNYGPVVEFVPLLKFGNRLYFRNMDEGGGILCRSDDMKTGTGEPGGECAICPLSRFGSARGGEGKGTACSEFMNFAVLVVEDGALHSDSICILSMKSSHIDAAKHLVGLAMRRKLSNGERAPMWAGIYTMTSRSKKFTEKLSAYVPLIDNAGWVKQQYAKIAQDAYQFMYDFRKQGRKIVTDVDEETIPE